MHPPTHALLSWLVAETRSDLTRRDRVLVLAAGLVPDLDGLTIVSPELYERYHRQVTHNVVAAAVVALGVAVAARHRIAATALALVAFHLHLACDVVGAAGPDGSIWSVAYWQPFSPVEWRWENQWPLAGWQNVTITIAALVASGFLAVRRGRSIVEAVSLRGDAAVCATLRRRFRPREQASPPT